MKTTKKWSRFLPKPLFLVGMFSMVLAFGSVGGMFAVSPLFDLKSGPTEQKNTVFLDVGTIISYLPDGFGIGAGYERAFNDSWTGLIHVAAGGYDYGDSGYGKQSAFAFQIDVHGRWYFFKTALDKLFVDLGLGYDYYKYTYDYSTTIGGRKYSYDYSYDQSSLLITPQVGWKFIFGKGFVLEPAIGYTIGIPLNKPELGSGVSAYNSSHLAVSIGLGWAF